MEKGIMKEVPHTGQVFKQLNWKKVCRACSHVGLVCLSVCVCACACACACVFVCVGSLPVPRHARFILL